MLKCFSKEFLSRQVAFNEEVQRNLVYVDGVKKLVFVYKSKIVPLATSEIMANGECRG